MRSGRLLRQLVVLRVFFVDDLAILPAIAQTYQSNYHFTAIITSLQLLLSEQ